MSNKEFITITNEEVYKEIVALRKDLETLKIQVAAISAVASIAVTIAFKFIGV